jgi:hypothetical protein
LGSLEGELKAFWEKWPDRKPITVDVIVNNVAVANALIDTGSAAYCFVSSKFVRKNDLKRIRLPEGRKAIQGVGNLTTWVTSMVKLKLDMSGHVETSFAYVLDSEDYDMILGRPWMDRFDVTIAPAKKSIFIHGTQTRIRSREEKRAIEKLRFLNAAAYSTLIKRSKRDSSINLFAASLADIEKAFKKKSKSDPQEKQPDYLKPDYKIFLREEADKLAPHRGPAIDHKIKILMTDGKEAEIPWEPLYNMSKDELLVLQKELTSYLERRFICVSRLSAAAPVAERANGITEDQIRASMIASGLPMRLWPYCAHYMARIHNLISNSTLPGKITPMESWN